MLRKLFVIAHTVFAEKGFEAATIVLSDNACQRKTGLDGIYTRYTFDGICSAYLVQNHESSRSAT